MAESQVPASAWPSKTFMVEAQDTLNVLVSIGVAQLADTVSTVLTSLATEISDR